MTDHPMSGHKHFGRRTKKLRMFISLDRTLITDKQGATKICIGLIDENHNHPYTVQDVAKGRKGFFQS